MSLDPGKLEKVRELGGGIIRARCPACAEADGDTKGEHLRLSPDGKYGCAANPGDKAHRKRIHQLAKAEPAKWFPLPRREESPPIKPRQIKPKNWFGTLGTANSDSLPIKNTPTPIPKPLSHARKEKTPVPRVPKPAILPYFTADGTLVIPFDSPIRFHWWNGGQPLKQTIREFKRPKQ